MKRSIEHESRLTKWLVVVVVLLGILVTGFACSSTISSVTPHVASLDTNATTDAFLPTGTVTADMSTLAPTPGVSLETLSTASVIPVASPTQVPLSTTVELDDRVSLDPYTVFYSTVSQEEAIVRLSIWRMCLDGSNKLLLFQDMRQRRAVGTPTAGPLGEMDYYLTDLVLSPDRTKLAFVYIATHRGSTGQPNNSIWVMNVDGSELRELARLDFLGTSSWAPDSSKLLFNRKGRYFWADVASGDIMEIGEWGATSWSPDGQWLAAALWQAPTKEQGIYIVSLEGWKRLIWPIAEAPGQDAFLSDIAWSPNGEKIAFAINSTQPGCFTVSPEGSNLEEIMSGPCSGIRWSPDGQRLALSLSDRAEHTRALYMMELGKEPRLIQKRSLASLHVWSFDGKAILSCTEEWELEAIFGEEQAIIRVPTDSGLVSFTW